MIRVKKSGESEIVGVRGYRGGTGEVQGRYRGGTGEVQGRYRGRAENDKESEGYRA